MNLKNIIQEITGVLFLLIAALFIYNETNNLWISLLVFPGMYFIWHLISFTRFNSFIHHADTLGNKNFYGAWPILHRNIVKTQQLQRQQETYDSEKQNLFEHVVSQLQQGVLTLDNSQRLIWCNSAAETLTGIQLTKDKGTNITNLIQDRALEKAIQNTNTSTFELLSPLNNASILSAKILPSQSTATDPDQFKSALLLSDVTEQFYTYQTKKDFVANVSHELKTPLTVIKGYLQLMANSDNEMDKWRRPVELMQAESTRMENLIQSLMLLSKIENQTEPEDNIIAVSEMIKDITKQAASVYESKEPDFKTTLNASLKLKGHEPYIHSIISNLIMNAVIHNEPRCSIKISWQINSDGHAEFIVDDDGEGIPNRHITRLTERFYQVDKSRSHTDSNNTGLGLSIVKHALAQIQSKLIITSSPGNGSRFQCLFAIQRTVLEDK